MVSALEVAQAHQRRIIGRTDKAIRKAVRAWAAMEFADLDGSWQTVGQTVLATAQLTQNANAADANSYMSQATRSYGAKPSDLVVNSSAFVGIDGSGRELSALLFGAVTTTKQSVGLGLGSQQSLLAGQLYLASMMKTALHDTSRSADLTAATGDGYTRYVRVVNAGACSRCAVLAGISSARTPFKRHPACKCSSFPIEDGETSAPSGFHDNAEDYFESLPPAEQDRVFTKAGAEAIRAGADISQLVTARRGATGIQYGNAIGRGTRANSGRRMLPTQIGRNADGSPIYGYVTTEGNTRRGQFGELNRNLGEAEQRLSGARYASTKYTRLMPETIVGLTDDVELRKALLRDAGYLNVPGSTRSAARLELAARDRAEATEFYRSLGIQLGG